ncbi:MAG: ABC transporter permease [Deltaproteobacteria bacterium]|nr:ABC transporter permease [Deltaproteobacteria bacterium]
MNLATYARRNMFRRKGRTIWTMIAIALTVLIFCLIRTALVSWDAAAEDAQQDRLVSRHKVSFTMSLPLKDITEVRQVDGVANATFASWFGAKDPLKRVQFMAGFAVDKDSYFEVVNEMSVDPKQLADWKATKTGVIIGDVLAEKLETGVGKKLKIESDIYPGDWEFDVVGIYTPLRRTVDRMSMIMRWDMLNDDPRNAWGKDRFGWMMVNIKDAGRGAEVSKAIDRRFDEMDDQTLTMSERQFQLGFIGSFAAVLSALGYVSAFILLIMVLILANTVAMSVRERTHEYGVLRAIGFSPKHLVTFILGESMLVALAGGLLGVLLTFLLINNMAGPALEKQGGFFAFFKTPGWLMGLALAIAMIVGLVAGLVPAIRASRLRVTDALRRQD